MYESILATHTNTQDMEKQNMLNIWESLHIYKHKVINQIIIEQIRTSGKLYRETTFHTQ